MPSPVIPKPVMIFRPIFHCQEGDWSNLLYASIDGAVDSLEEVKAITDAVATAFGPKVADVMAVGVSMQGMWSRYITATNDWEYFTVEGSFEGERPGNTLPIQDCFEIRKLTGAAGRAKRGRYFFSGLSVDDVSNGLIENEISSPLLTLAGFLAADVHVGDRTVHWRHWDRKDNMLVPISNCTVVRRLVSRRDRAKKEAYTPITQAL